MACAAGEEIPMHDTAIWAAKVTDAGQRIATLLSRDIRAFVTGEVKRRFVDNPAMADALDDAGVTALKQDAHAFAERTARATAEALGDEGLWLGAEAAAADAPVTRIPAVQAVLQRAADDLGELLERHGLGPDGPLAYRLPMRFIDGENLSTLTRSLWKSLSHYHAARQATAEAREASSRESRVRRWDEA